MFDKITVIDHQHRENVVAIKETKPEFLVTKDEMLYCSCNGNHISHTFKPWDGF